ncbi:calcineurin-like phosphoesterase [Nitzschia inconspicua]|uniref:Calcineurin-like phosphoesterase n=1 Tax=Nitzschia inconspicua TaxID=303405 RepID=A0A9K3PNJ8_9STRA|nr:calcineurin-like phosphoesterase [Nitzschia inconspicua]
MSLESFQEILSGLFFGRGGGRRPDEANQEALDSNDVKTWLQPCQPHEARLTIVQITDVYTLDNFASLKTMLQEIRKAQGPHDKVISMLTGDFLAPYLLSSIDRGEGMMMAINETPIDYLTWGNHEADIPHKHVCRHVKNYTGTFINTNMQSHDSMKYDCSVPYEIIEISSPDGKHQHKIGLVALLSNDPKLYSHFKEPAFGGATIEDPWETLAKYKKLLEEEHGCDLVIPLEHMYVPENTKTTEIYKDCQSIPLILSGHDHHRIDQKINNTRLIKPGMDAVHAAIIEIVYDKNDPNAKPIIRSTFVPTSTYQPCPELKAKTDAAYDVLLPLRNTMLAQVLPQFLPLTSKNARGSVCTMGKLVCSMLKQALLQDYYAATDESSSDEEENHNNLPIMQKKIDAVILMGGNIRGNEDYPDDSFFSLETLEAEIKSDEVVGFTEMPGSVLAAGIEATHAGDPIPGWFQYDDGITQDPVTKKVLTVNGKPINPKRVYRVATKIKDLTNGQSPPLKEYFLAHPELLPAKGQYVNIHSTLMKFFARGMFRKLWEATGELIPDPELAAEDYSHPVNMNRIEGRLRLAVLDRDNDGFVTVDDIHHGLRDFLGLSVEDEYKNLARKVHACADITGKGVVSVEDF